MGLFCLCLLFGCFWVFALLGLAVAYRNLPISRGSFRVRSSPDISIWDSLACLALGPHRPLVSPVLCGLRLTRLTCLTCCKGICRLWCSVFFVGVWCLCFFVWFVCLGVFGLFFGFVSCFPLLLARLSSFTDWCTAHRQQFREQKKTDPKTNPKRAPKAAPRTNLNTNNEEQPCQIVRSRTSGRIRRSRRPHE